MRGVRVLLQHPTTITYMQDETDFKVCFMFQKHNTHTHTHTHHSHTHFKDLSDQYPRKTSLYTPTLKTYVYTHIKGELSQGQEWFSSLVHHLLMHTYI